MMTHMNKLGFLFLDNSVDDIIKAFSKGFIIQYENTLE